MPSCLYVLTWWIGGTTAPVVGSGSCPAWMAREEKPRCSWVMGASVPGRRRRAAGPPPPVRAERPADWSWWVAQPPAPQIAVAVASPPEPVTPQPPLP